jgi:hypothetical protein
VATQSKLPRDTARFARCESSWIARRRFFGSGRSVSRETAMLVIWLPGPSAARVETGHMATSGCSGVSPRSRSQRWTAEPTISSTTSLNVTSKCFFSRRTRSNSSEAVAKPRRGPTARLKDRRSTGAASSRVPAAARSRRPRVR